MAFQQCNTEIGIYPFAHSPKVVPFGYKPITDSFKGSYMMYKAILEYKGREVLTAIDKED